VNNDKKLTLVVYTRSQISLHNRRQNRRYLHLVTAAAYFDNVVNYACKMFITFAPPSPVNELCEENHHRHRKYYATSDVHAIKYFPAVITQSLNKLERFITVKPKLEAYTRE